MHKKAKFWMGLFGIGILCIGSYLFGTYTNSNISMTNDQQIVKLNKNYEKLVVENQKNQELVKATTEEIKRLTQELKNYKANEKLQNKFTEKSNEIALEVVSDHIKANESFSAMAYCDSDGRYRNGYGTLAVFKEYKVGETVQVRDCKGKIATLVATEKMQLLPEGIITEQEALERKEMHLIKHVFPYLYGKTFRSQEEFIVATDVIYNRGIAQSRNLFNADGTINCKSLYSYMTHSKKAYQKIMQKRYAKNYALCIQS